MSIKILHTGDIHLGDMSGPTKDGRNLRRDDTLRCMDAIVERAKAERPHLTIIAGDLFNRSRVWADTALEDVNDALNRFLRPLCGCSEYVALLFGTMNHDNPRAFEVIQEAARDLRNLLIFTTPEVRQIETTGGAVQIVAVPGFDKGRMQLFFPGADKETENRNATALVNDIILGLCSTIRKDIPSILTAHYTVSGSEADNGNTFLAGQDVVILPGTIDATGVTLACFGHIHKPQRLACSTPAYYCGSPNQLTFNDEGTEHGFYIHDILTFGTAGPDFPAEWQDKRVVSTFYTTPERKHFTFRMAPEDVGEFLSTGKISRRVEGLEDAIVRVRYTCSAEQDKAFNRAELQKKLLAAGAFHVAEIIPEDIEELNAKDQLTERDGPAECLARWLALNEIHGDTAARLMELAAPIIRQADDGRDANEHTGAFIPMQIEVKNYRSYTKAEFDFGPVQMAMVNGQNGVGKSSLFMDALADCLYEQSRKEDIGGWVRDGSKSGSITFTFGMGGQKYRVVRTRTKSGRGTLALHRFDTDANEWKDESDTTMKLTQAKIIRLLGMDCNTFCSIALIRQDAYGLFLETDSDRRMEVLSALLGLDIYTRMEEIAKNGATATRREINQLKDRITILGEQASEKDLLISQDESLATEAVTLQSHVEATEGTLSAAETAEALRQEIIRQEHEKRQQASDYGAQANKKQGELDGLKGKRDSASRLHAGLSAAQTAADAVKKARATIERLSPDVERCRSLQHERRSIQSDIERLNNRAAEIARSKRSIQSTLDKQDEIYAAQKALEDLAPKMEDARRRLDGREEASKKAIAAKEAVDAYLAGSRERISALNQQVTALQAEASRIADSGCTAPDGASCKFLASARSAVQKLPALEAKLDDTKRTDKVAYLNLLADYNAARENVNSFGRPLDDINRLSKQERNLRSVADQAPALAAAEAKLHELAEEEIRIAAERKGHEDRLAKINAEYGGLASAVLETQEAQDIIRQNEGLANTLAVCMSAKARMEELDPQIEQITAEIAELKEKQAIATLDAQDVAARIPRDTPNIDQIRSNLTSIRQAISQNATRRGQIAAKMERITEAEAQIAELREKVEHTGVTLQDYMTLVQAFGLDGIQYMIIRGVVPEIMRRSNEILGAMTGGRMAVDFRTEREQKSTKTIVNSLEVWINTIAGTTRPYQSHSGGEKVRISLAVTLGLADVKAHRTGVQLGMLWIDEPPFLDAEGTEAYADALCSMAQRNPDMRILAISHDPAMKGRFAQNIIVTAGENGSTVTME